MVSRPDDLRRLERVARLKADLELRKFAAFRRHMTSLRAESERLRAELEAEYARPLQPDVAGMRLAHACTRAAAARHLAAEADAARLTPAFDAARSAAQREFGRAEVIAALERRRRARLRQLRDRALP